MNDFEAPDWRALHSSLARRKRFAFCPVGYYLYHVPGRDGYAGYPGSWRYWLYTAKHRVSAAGWIMDMWRRSVSGYYLPGVNFRRRKLTSFIRSNFEREFGLLENGSYLTDPKLVKQVIELDEKIFNFQYFYDWSLHELDQLTEFFCRCSLYERLQQLPMLNFRNCRDDFQWQLGGVNFYQHPDVVWRDRNMLEILDMNSYSHAQERLRTAELYRVYAVRFMHIPESAVRVHFICPCREEYMQINESDEDFTQLFRQLSGEAVMWRDYLLRQYASASAGEWLYARKDNCKRCRFALHCPALNGTPEPEYGSI